MYLSVTMAAAMLAGSQLLGRMIATPLAKLQEGADIIGRRSPISPFLMRSSGNHCLRSGRCAGYCPFVRPARGWGTTRDTGRMCPDRKYHFTGRVFVAVAAPFGLSHNAPASGLVAQFQVGF